MKAHKQLKLFLICQPLSRSIKNLKSRYANSIVEETKNEEQAKIKK